MGTTRREFLSAGSAAGAAWLIHDLVGAREALAWARNAIQQQPAPRFQTLSPHEALVVEAVSARIIPTDDSPGAREAGAVYFIDRALATFLKDGRPLIRMFVRDLDRAARRLRRSSSGFVGLSESEQDQVLKKLENTDGFSGLHYMTIAGTLANPSWGGNRDMVGWHLIGAFPHGSNEAPFGYYDEEANRK